MLGALGVGVALFALSIALDSSSHSRIIVGTGIAGLLYSLMAVTLWRYRKRTPLLLRVMSAFDGLLATLLLSKVAIGLFYLTMVPYANTLINALLYVTAFIVMSNNGFGFLLLIKNEDDQQLRSALDDLDQANAQQRHFIAMLSHEVRTPVAVIDSSVQLLALKARQQADYLPLVERMTRGLERLKDFLDNCLTQDRLNSPNFTHKPERVPMCRLVQLKQHHLQELGPQHQINFCLPEDELVVLGDATLLRILLENLLSNAIKYSPPGSTITMQLALVDAHPVPRCRLEVADQGPGIDDEELKLIFQKYKRGRAADRLPGAGLGLAIVMRIVQLHGGTITAGNRPAGGACFVVEIPCAGGLS